jgi:hypothetical protein
MVELNTVPKVRKRSVRFNPIDPQGFAQRSTSLSIERPPLCLKPACRADTRIPGPLLSTEYLGSSPVSFGLERVQLNGPQDGLEPKERGFAVLAGYNVQ